MIRIQLNVAASGPTRPPSPTVWPFLANGNPLASLSPWTLTARGVPVTSLDCHTLHHHVPASPFAGKTPVTSRVVLLPSGHRFLSPRSLSLQRSLAVPPTGYTVAFFALLDPNTDIMAQRGGHSHADHLSVPQTCEQTVVPGFLRLLFFLHRTVFSQIGSSIFLHRLDVSAKLAACGKVCLDHLLWTGNTLPTLHLSFPHGVHPCLTSFVYCFAHNPLHPALHVPPRRTGGFSQIRLHLE